MNTLAYRENGIAVKSNFLSDADIDALRIEAGRLFKVTQILGMAYCVRLSKFLCELPNPAARIQSVNLLETAIDIHAELLSLGYTDYKLAHVAMYQEKGNPTALHWHSDIRESALIRAQICISGGQLDSGAFRYVKNSNQLEITLANSEPTHEYMQAHADDIVTCNVPNGSLVMINTKGYHSKCPCVGERISLMFDFLPQSFIDQNPDDITSDVYLTVSRLSPKVIENLSLFMTGVSTAVSSHNTSERYKFFKLFAGSNLGDFLAIVPPVVDKIRTKLRARMVRLPPFRGWLANSQRQG